jgi:hypothetical protein
LLRIKYNKLSLLLNSALLKSAISCWGADCRFGAHSTRPRHVRVGESWHAAGSTSTSGEEPLAHSLLRLATRTCLCRQPKAPRVPTYTTLIHDSNAGILTVSCSNIFACSQASNITMRQCITRKALCNRHALRTPDPSWKFIACSISLGHRPNAIKNAIKMKRERRRTLNAPGWKRIYPKSQRNGAHFAANGSGIHYVSARPAQRAHT